MLLAKKTWQDNYLLINDLQIPYEHPKALEFYKYLKKHFSIPNENCLCLGDETDQYFGGMWKKSPDARHSAITELEDSIRTLKKWYAAFPEMKVAISNHGTRWWRKALEAEIPSQLMRAYREIICAPVGWEWKDHWVIKASKHTFMIEHGDNWGTQKPHVLAAIHNGCSTAVGHHHTIYDVKHIKTKTQQIWAVAGGACIDFNAYAFDYAKKYKFQPIPGGVVVVNGGKIPLLIPMD